MADQEDPIVTTRRPFNASVASVVLAAFSFVTIWVLPGLLPETYVGYEAVAGALAALGALLLGIVGARRAKRAPEAYSGFWLGIAGAALSIFWLAGGFVSGVLQKVATGTIFRDPGKEAIAQCESGRITGTCDQAGIYLIDHAKDRPRALALLEKGCRGGDVYSCWIIASRLEHDTPKVELDAVIAQGKKLCAQGGDPIHCDLFTP
jgi:hypothetical protein